MLLSRIFNVANMCFNAIHDNKILAKILEFTVWSYDKILFKYFSSPNLTDIQLYILEIVAILIPHEDIEMWKLPVCFVMVSQH